MKNLLIAFAFIFVASFAFTSCDKEKCETCTITTLGIDQTQAELCGTDSELDDAQASFQATVDAANAAISGSTTLTCDRK